MKVCKVHSIFHQRAGFRVRLEPNHWHSVLQRELRNLSGVGKRQWVFDDHESRSLPRRSPARAASWSTDCSLLARRTPPQALVLAVAYTDELCRALSRPSANMKMNVRRRL